MKSSLRFLFTAAVIATLVIPNSRYAKASDEALEMVSTPINFSDVGQPDAELTDYVVERSTSAKILNEKGVEIGQKRIEGTEGDSFSTKAFEGRLVKVLAVSDEEYRTAHTDWIDRVTRIIESADDIYNTNFSIDFDVVAYSVWNSSGSTSSALLADLADNGYSGYDLVIGFTGDSHFTDGGLAYRYSSDPVTGYSLNFDQTETSTYKAARHEVAHNYGVSDHSDSVMCINNDNYTYSASNWDTTHKNLISSHKTWFGVGVN
ncbi:M12 family metallo-peptidase [Paenibacillus sp. CMAA1364]